MIHIVVCPRGGDPVPPTGPPVRFVAPAAAVSRVGRPREGGATPSLVRQARQPLLPQRVTLVDDYLRDTVVPCPVPVDGRFVLFLSALIDITQDVVLFHLSFSTGFTYFSVYIFLGFFG